MQFISGSRNPIPLTWVLLSLVSAISVIRGAETPVKVNPRPNNIHQDSAKASDKPSRSRVILGAFKTGPTGALGYEVSVAPCADMECPFQVRLLEGTKVWATLDLDWMKAHGPVTKEKVDESSGVGDPLQPDTQQTAWSTGEEKENVSTVARSVRLAPELNGLLVDQRAGFDRLKRRHYLFVARENKLTRVWQQEEGAGPTWSTVETVNSPRDGSLRLLYFSGFRYPSNDQPDWLQLSVYRWNPAKNELQLAAPELPSVFAVIAGSYSTVAKAREAQEGNTCLGGFWVLNSDEFSKLGPGNFVLAAVSHSGHAASRSSEALKSCVPSSPVSVIRSSYGKPEGK